MAIIEGLSEARDYYLHKKTDKVRVSKVEKAELIALRPYSSKEVKEIRTRYNMTQEYFAEVMGVTVDTVRKWEQKGRIKSGLAIRMLQLIEIRGIPADLIVTPDHG
jgi:DNA-binding transcriptional regulator YiaG